MAAPTPTPHVKESYPGTVEQLGKLLGLLTIGTYASGYLILSLYYAHFNVTHIDPLRTRVLAVGAVFIFLTSLPVIALKEGFSLVGRPELDALDPPAGSTNNMGESQVRQVRAAWLVVRACNTYYIASIISFLTGLFMFQSPRDWHSDWRAEAVWLSVLAVWIVFFLRSTAWFIKAPRATATLAGTITTALLVAIPVTSSNPAAIATFWFFMIGLWALPAAKPLLATITDWRSWLLPIVLVNFYVTQVFAVIRPSLGGGEPVPVELVLRNAGDLPGVGSQSKTLLIDETEAGYLISSGQKVFFVSRAGVASIRFVQ